MGAPGPVARRVSRGRESGDGPLDLLTRDEAEHVEDRAELLVRGPGLAELLGQLLDPASIALEIADEARLADGLVSARQGRPVTKGLHLGLQPVGALHRRPELLPGGVQAAPEIGPIRRIGLVWGLVPMPRLGRARRPLGLIETGDQVVTLAGQGLDLVPSRIELAADLLHLLMERDEVQVVLAQGGLVVALLAVELALKHPDLAGQLIGTSACVLRLGDVPVDLGLESGMFLACGLGLLDRGIALPGQGLGFAHEAIRFLLKGLAIAFEPGMDGVEPRPPIPRLGLGSGLLLDEPALGVPESSPELLAARLRGPPLGLPPGDGLVATPGELAAGRFVQGGLLGQPTSDLAQLDPELLIQERARQVIDLQAVALGADGLQFLRRGR